MKAVGVDIKDGYFGTYFQGKDKELMFKEQGKAVIVKEKLEEVETGHQSLRVEYDNNGLKTFIIPRNELVVGSSSKWLGRGIDAYDYLMKILLQTIHQQEEGLPYHYVHKGVGWLEIEGEKVYRANEMIVPSSLNLKSKYNGALDIEAKGSLKDWKKGIEEEVLGHTPLEFALCIGVVAILIGYFKQIDESLIINLFNDSSKGKTTACMLAASISYRPRFGQNTLMSTWNNTENYLMGLLSDNYGMLTVLDEASLIKSKDISILLYTLASGTEKGRMDSTAQLKETRVWNTCILSTGESALEEISNQNSGLKVRKLEYGDVMWTKDASHSDRLKSIVQENYGFAGLEIARYLVDGDYLKLESEYLQHVQMFLDQCTCKNELTDRIAKKQGLILYSAQLLNQVLGLTIDKQNLLEFLDEHNKEEQSEIEERAYDYIMQMVAKNEGKFARRYINGKRGTMTTVKRNKFQLETEHCPDKDVLGMIWIDEVTRTRKIGIIPEELKKMLLQGGFSSPASILKRMKKRGWLDTEDKKLTRRKKISPEGSLIALNIIIDQTKLDEEEPLTTLEKEMLEREKDYQDELAQSIQEIINTED